MDSMATRALVTNQQVATDLGITHSAVSRIRSGERRPSLDLLIRIADVFGWSVDDQAYSLSYGNYAADLETKLTVRYG